MRSADILRLALSVLYQQKLRTLLTTLGVLFGTFVLVASLAVGRGVQDTIQREWTRFRELRRIEVLPRYQAAKPPDLSQEEFQVRGTMSEAKRERLRQELIRRWQGQHAAIADARLNPEQLRRLAELDHVRAVVPSIYLPGRVVLNGRSEAAVMHSAPPDHKVLRELLQAGEFLTGWDGRCAVVSEYLLYRLGAVSEADVEGILGKKLHVAYDPTAPKANTLLYLLRNSRSGTGSGEIQLLEKLVRQLPAALEKLDLTPEERQSLRKILQRPPDQPATDPVVTEELTIVGVFRAPTRDDPRLSREWWITDVDIVLPVRTAEELCFRMPSLRERGLDEVTVEVDETEHVKEVSEKIKEMGLNSYSLVEAIEREQFIYLMIFTSMTCIAVVALVVAALGIINTMLMSVLERTREIGVMKAVGARDSHIRLIFLVEGALIGMVGGLFGLLLSWAASIPGDAWVRSMVAARLNFRLQESVFVFPLWLVVGAPLFASVITTLAAVYPAHRAARVNPITTLRHE